jgi:hypothetical protein
MSTIALKDILIGARQEAYRMRHFYLGAEHLFVALLEMHGSIASNIVKEYGLTPEYVINAIRRKVGKGSKHRLWAGVPNTPRMEVILDIAGDLSLDNDREEINERDLLLAIFMEQDSVPVRVLSALGLDNIPQLTQLATDYTIADDLHRPYVDVTYGPGFDRAASLSAEQLLVLRRMFYGYQQIRVERRLVGGYSNALLLVVTPVHADGREDAAVAAKISHVDAILDEARRYEVRVRNSLPPLTARLEDKPATPEGINLAGLKYTLVTSGNNRAPMDLRAILQEWDPVQLGLWIKRDLFPTFGQLWWKQSRPYRFQAWREYDWLLPPILTLELSKEKQLSPQGFTVRMPLKRSRLRQLEYGDLVAVENFIVRKIYPERNAIQLAAGHGTESAHAYKIEIRGIDLDANTYYRGEIIEHIIGSVWKTRSEQLLHALRSLEPDFDPTAERIPGVDKLDDRLPNPIIAFDGLLDSYVDGSLSTIHGDLHLGNIMIGPNNSSFLIDFAHTRDGHTLFDWAVLEVNLLCDIVMPIAGTTWPDVRAVVQQLVALNGGLPPNDPDSPITQALAVVANIREIVQECLAVENKWSEYYVALAFCALRAMMWETLSLSNRRLMLMVSALAIHELRTRFRPGSDSNLHSPEVTDINMSFWSGEMGG